MMFCSKSAVVTGSTSGIGLAIARALAKEGANVLINGFGEPHDIEKERAGLEAEFGVKAIYSPADMSKPHEIEEMMHPARRPSAASTFSSTMRASSSSRRSRIFRSRNGTRSSPSTCRPPSMRSARRCRA